MKTCPFGSGCYKCLYRERHTRIPLLWGFTWITVPVFIYLIVLDFPDGSVVKNPSTNAGDSGSIPGLRGSPRKGNGNPVQYSCLGNPTGRGAWRATVSMGSQKSQIQLSN